MVLFYERINWENYPSMNTAINALNLNKIDLAVKTLDERTVQLDTTKAEQATVLNTVQDWSLDESTGIITITKVNGENISFDLNIEKIPVNFELSEDGILTMTTDDGTVFTADIGSMIPIIELESSSTVSVIKDSGISELATNIKNFTYTFDEPFTGKICIKASLDQVYNAKIITEDGEIGGLCSGSYFPYVKNALSFSVESTLDLERIYLDYSHIQKYKFEIPDGAITEQKLNPNYLAEIKLQAENATQSATSASASATQASESATRAYDEAERAKLYADTVQEGITTTTSRTLTESHAGGLKINSMDGESQQNQYSGKNLWNVNKNSITISANGDYSTPLGIVDLKKDETITVSCKQSTTLTSCLRNTFGYHLNGSVKYQTATDNYSLGSGVKKWTFTVPEDGSYNFFRWCNTPNATVTYSDFQIEYGSNVTDYEPFVGGIPSPNPDYPQDIKSVEVGEIKSAGKNFLKSTATSGTTSSGVTFTVKENKSIAVNGSTSTEIAKLVAEHTLEDGEYILSGRYSANCFLRVMGHKNGTWSYITQTSSADNMKFTMDNSVYGKILVQCIVTANASLNNAIIEPMIRKADVDDYTYEPHHEKSIQLSAPITLRGIGHVKDVLCKRDGVFGVASEYNPFILDGTQSVARSLQEGGNGTYRFSVVDTVIQSKIKKPKESEVAEILTTALSAKTYNQVYWSQEGISVYTTGTFHIYHDKFKNFTVEEMKAWLAGNPINGFYRLATPTFEPLPLADQIALHQLETFDTVTYISTDSEIEPIMEVEYGTSKVGAYTIKGMNTADANALKIERLNTLTNELATQLVAGSEV